MKTIEPDQFDQNKRAYPFKNGNISRGIKVTDRSVTFVGQTGPVKKYGVNGCQIDDMIAFARKTIEVFNMKFHSPFNDMAIDKLKQAEMYLEERRQNRVARGVEGTNEE